jgi:hypothetical protein
MSRTKPLKLSEPICQQCGQPVYPKEREGGTFYSSWSKKSYPSEEDVWDHINPEHPEVKATRHLAAPLDNRTVGQELIRVAKTKGAVSPTLMPEAEAIRRKLLNDNQFNKRSGMRGSTRPKNPRPRGRGKI